MNRIICLWSGPRNVSTAFMYSFAQRPDTTVVDEPLYAHYLRASGAAHPGRQEVLDTMEQDGEKVVDSLLHHPTPKPLLFVKNMAHHFTALAPAFLSRMDNIFLIRHPKEMLPSLIKQIPEPILRDTGYEKQVEILGKLVGEGQKPIVVDSKGLRMNPKGMLKRLCQQLDIPFYGEMLHWEAGPRPEDGCWAKHWYHSLHRSTGFASYEPKTAPFPKHLKPLSEVCLPLYKQLSAYALEV